MSDRAQVDTDTSPAFTPFLAGGAVGLLLGLLVGSVVGSLFARPIGAAVRSLRRRLGADDEPHFEFLAQ
jgi:urea transporter